MSQKVAEAADKFAKPQEVDAVTAAFGGNTRELMPTYEDIPKEFRDCNKPHKWVKFQRDWFYGGISTDGLIAKDGIDLKVALRHLGTIQGSFSPKHEHKEAAVAYLASRWLTAASTWTVKKPL